MEVVNLLLAVGLFLAQSLGATVIRPGDAVVDEQQVGVISGDVLDVAADLPAGDLEVRLLRPAPSSDRTWPEPWVLERVHGAEELARVRTSPGGRFEFRGLSPGRYQVRARDPSGAIAAADVLITVDRSRRSVTLEITREGGIGVRLDFQEGAGPRVRDLIAGMAAAEGGLEVGDVISALDGRATSGMRIRAFVEACRGPVGTTVRVQVRRGDEEFELELDRRVFPGRR